MLNYLLRGGGDIRSYVISILLCLPIILISLSFHETAHGFIAYKCGDSTAKNYGRLTLNPLKHIDPFGFISMLLIGYGWAKPVPINSRNFRKPKRDIALTAAAGPVSNLLLAIVFAIVLKLAYEGLSLVRVTSDAVFYVIYFILLFLYYGIQLNVTLALFNLIPVPPFDGSRILYVVLPTKWYFKIMQYEKYIYIVFFLLIATGFLSPILSRLTDTIVELLFKLVSLPDIFGIF